MSFPLSGRNSILDKHNKLSGIVYGLQQVFIIKIEIKYNVLTAKNRFAIMPLIKL